MFSRVLFALGLASFAAAHGGVLEYLMDGTYYKGYAFLPLLTGLTILTLIPDTQLPAIQHCRWSVYDPTPMGYLRVSRASALMHPFMSEIVHTPQPHQGRE